MSDRRSVLDAAVMAAFGLLAAACQTARHPRDHVPTLSIPEYVRILETRRGETVRFCGRLTPRGELSPGEWMITDLGEPDPIHGTPRIYVIPHRGEAPRLDREGCLTGKIARKDGSIELGSYQIRHDGPLNMVWYLHAIPAKDR